MRRPPEIPRPDEEPDPSARRLLTPLENRKRIEVLRSTEAIEGRHGKVRTYKSGCRCERCRIGFRETEREARRRRRGRRPPSHVHGTVNGYNYWRCRCEECKAANAEYRRAGRNDPDRPHGTLSMYGLGCRCRACRVARRDKGREHRRKKKGLPTPEWVHGTTNGYINWGCRCDGCKAAASMHRKEGHEKALAGPVPDRAHGTRSGYQHYGCRCEECRAASYAYEKKRRIPRAMPPRSRHAQIKT
jgi:hypothetical protein